MKITDVKLDVLVWPRFENPFWTSINEVGQVSELVVRLRTDDGIWSSCRRTHRSDQS